MSAISAFLSPLSFLQSRQIFLNVSLLSHLPIGLIIQANFLIFSPGIENASVISERRLISFPIAHTISPIIPKKKPFIYSSKGFPPVSRPGTSLIIIVSTSTFLFLGSNVTFLIVGGQPIIAPQAMS